MGGRFFLWFGIIVAMENRILAMAFVALLASSLYGDDDPSVFPVRSLEDESVYVERIRLLADFNRDGREDMALSEPVEDFGRMGGVFEIYLALEEGEWRLIGIVIAHPKAISLESSRKKGQTRLWTYLRGGGNFGGLGFFEIARDHVEDFEGIEITPGDGGTSTGNAMYQAVFARSEIPIKFEKSTTSKTGLVSWAAVAMR
tara:strand:- start:20336 stop:20938 length:603 start_codon:yes stop_codon:yes gene_type:complete